MYKKLISAFSALALLTLLVPSTFAEAIKDETIITSTTLSIVDGSPNSFKPVVGGEPLKIDLAYNTATYDAQLQTSTGYVRILKEGVLVEELTAWTDSAEYPTDTIPWNGMCNDNDDVACVDGDYQVAVYTSFIDGADLKFDKDTTDFHIGEVAVPLEVSSFGLNYDSTDNTFDPVLNEGTPLKVSYALSGTEGVMNDDNSYRVAINIDNENGDTVDTYSTTDKAKLAAGFSEWNGEYGLKLVDPGNYTAKLTVEKNSQILLTDSAPFTIKYESNSKPNFVTPKVTPDSFDPDFDYAYIYFTVDTISDVTVEIRNSQTEEVRDFTGYKHNSLDSNKEYEVPWDGKNNSGSEVSLGTYTAYVRAENDFGVSVYTDTVVVNNSGGNVSTSNSHIKDISFKPSTFEPAVDDELEIQFDVAMDIDSLKVTAERGTESIELYDDQDVEKENNIEVFWDGTDDNDDYVAGGSWKILFETKKDNSTLLAAKTITVKYDEPKIEEFEVSKDKFDNDLDEFTMIMFKIDMDAEVDLFVLLDGDEDEEIIEEMEVEEDKWYAIEWDGSGYDYEDDIDIQIKAKNMASDDVYDTDTVSVNLSEDYASSSKSNVSEDYISPVITDGNDDMLLHYNLEDDADVTVSIHKGKTSSGTKMIELIDVKDQNSGDHDILWNGKDDDGDKLAKGYYTYKIVSYKKSSETETGLFVVGEVGEIDGTAGESGNISDNDSGNISGNVVILDGGSTDDDDDDDTGYTPTTGNCGNFPDVSSNSMYCDAIDWVQEEGIFAGYPDGYFRPYQVINRAEVLKVILEGLNVSILPMDFTNLGFSDVQAGAWYMPYVKTAQLLGVFQGDSGKTTARPEASVNRVEMLKMVFETVAAKGGYTSTNCSYAYSDVAAGAWYNKYACSAKSFGLFSGTTLGAAAYSTRGEVADVLYKLNKAGVL